MAVDNGKLRTTAAEVRNANSNYSIAFTFKNGFTFREIICLWMSQDPGRKVSTPIGGRAASVGWILSKKHIV
jgi:hypothetical protein